MQNRIPGDRLAVTLKRYVEIGYLTFDKSNPGYRHPAPKEKTLDEIVDGARRTLAKRG